MFQERSNCHLFFTGIVVILTMATPFCIGQALEGCQGTCGNVTIPYPFGTKEGCYHDHKFLITCNTTFNPPKPFLGESNNNITSISLDEGEVTVMNYDVASDCYSENGSRISEHHSRVSIPNFRVSNRRNKFTLVGCDTYGYFKGSQGDYNYSRGCIADCNTTDNMSSGLCTGVGCCQASFPTGLDYFKVSVYSFRNHIQVWNISSCGYGFVVQENMYNFSVADLSGLQNVGQLPLVLDWTVGNETCNVTKESNKIICGNNSKCIDSYNGPGYRCICTDGYQGNPYLSSGCQDIDECGDPGLNQCEKKCTNTAGNYTCSCPKGYFGDGRKYGQGCIHDQSPVTKLVLGASVGLGSFFLVIGGWWLSKLIKKRKETSKRKKYYEKNGGLLLEQQMSSDKGTFEATKLYTLKELKKATDNYNISRVLGQGGQGTVYKGMLTDGTIVAVKKAKIEGEEKVDHFINEVVILSQINHRNIVKLLGYCLESEIPMLVYEYVQNGTLFQYIHNQIEEFPLSWELRLRIAAQVAGALSYLHSAASVPIYHRDIKSTNILLDEKYRAKVSDFGISRSISMDQTHLSTSVQGTFGYLDPEYFQSSQFTEKSDVYSFGVVLVELLTGKKVVSALYSEKWRSLSAYFMSKMEEKHLFDILDVRVAKEGDEEDILVVANLAMRCLNLNGKQRPTMREVVVELESVCFPKVQSSTTQDGEIQNGEEIEYPRDEVYGELESDSTSLFSTRRG